MADILNQDRLLQLDNVCTTPTATLIQLFEDLKGREDTIRSISEFRNFLIENYEIAHPRDFTGILIFIQSGVSKTLSDADKIIARIDQEMQEWDIDEDFLNRWSEKKKYIGSIASLSEIVYLTKKAELYLFNRYHVHSFKIISDLRPVFSADREKMEDLILFNKLFLTYSNQFEKEETLELVLGVDELEDLRREIDLAIKKASVVESEFAIDATHEVIQYRKRGEK